MGFRPNKRFKKDYNKLFKNDPVQANLLLLFCEMADEKGQVELRDKKEIAILMNARFENPMEYQL